MTGIEITVNEHGERCINGLAVLCSVPPHIVKHRAEVAPGQWADVYAVHLTLDQGRQAKVNDGFTTRRQANAWVREMRGALGIVGYTAEELEPHRWISSKSDHGGIDPGRYQALSEGLVAYYDRFPPEAATWATTTSRSASTASKTTTASSSTRSPTSAARDTPSTRTASSTASRSVPEGVVRQRRRDPKRRVPQQDHAHAGLRGLPQAVPHALGAHILEVHAGDPMSQTGAVHLRQSADRDGNGEAVTRQREDCRALARRRDVEVVAELVDNDTSASGRKARPGFEELLRLIEAKHVTVVIAWSWDRLTRNRRETLRLIEVGKAAGVTIMLARGSDIDLAITGLGRRTLFEHLGRLEAAGLLTRERRHRPDGTRAPNCYHLHLGQGAGAAHDGGGPGAPAAPSNLNSPVMLRRRPRLHVVNGKGPEMARQRSTQYIEQVIAPEVLTVEQRAQLSALLHGGVADDGVTSERVRSHQSNRKGAVMVEANAVPQPTVGVELVTPEQAVEYLGRNENRQLRAANVDYFVDLIDKGLFTLTSDAIAFEVKADGHEVLRNGQQRLQAIVKTNQAQQLLVMRNLPAGSMMVLDTGKKRSFADLLHLMRGVEDATNLCVVVRLGYRHEKGGTHFLSTGGGNELPLMELLDWFDRHPECKPAQVLGRSVYQATDLSMAACAVAKMLFDRVDAEDSEIFFEKLKSGAELRAGDPILALRKWILNQKKNRLKPRPPDQLAVIIKTFNDWSRGATRKYVKYDRHGEPFPEVIGLAS
jgi:Resolvase, N terminal domain